MRAVRSDQAAASALARRLAGHRRVRRTRRQRRHVAQDQVAGAEAALEPGFLGVLHDREGAEHVPGGVAVEAVKVEEHGIQPGATAQPVFLIPGAGRPRVALVAGEAFHVARGVSAREAHRCRAAA